MAKRAEVRKPKVLKGPIIKPLHRGPPGSQARARAIAAGKGSTEAQPVVETAAVKAPKPAKKKAKKVTAKKGPTVAVPLEAPMKFGDVDK